ncbi:MAG: Ldh family oxidoreductase, partial [bacterium]
PPQGDPVSETLYFRWESLRDAAHALCLATGSPEQEATLVANRLLKANLTGHDSHGIIRLAVYMTWVREGRFKAGMKPEFLMDNGSTALLTGNWGFGQVAAQRAMEVAIERGLRHGVAAVGVTELGHIGRLADYAVAASEAGLIGMVFTATGGLSRLVAPFGGAAARMSTNPICVAFPSDRGDPIVFDMATSVYAEGKFRVFRDAKAQAPENLLIDKQGQPTTDPEDFYDGGAILPLGGGQGYKGYLLNFMVEVLGGLLTGGGFVGRDKKPAFNNCTMMITVDVAKFRDLPDFKRELEALIGYLKDSPTQEGQEVLYPGELEARREAHRRAAGVPLAAKTVQDLQAELDRAGVPITLADQALAATPTPVG